MPEYSATNDDVESLSIAILKRKSFKPAGVSDKSESHFLSGETPERGVKVLPPFQYCLVRQWCCYLCSRFPSRSGEVGVDASEARLLGYRRRL